MLGLLLYPHRSLRRAAEAMPSSSFGTSGLRDYAQLLANTMAAQSRLYDLPSDVLAANHLDFKDAWRLIALRGRGTGGESTYSVLCNPEIVDHSGGSYEYESSFAFACVPAHLAAPRKLKVRYRTIHGSAREVDCDA